jgi:nucleoside phosphorylase
MLDDTHDRLPQHKNDDNSYVLGRIGDHNVVIATLPDKETGTNSATHVAAQLLRTFDSVRVGVMVGIGGGVPSLENDIRLGDVVVSRQKNETGDVIQYDYGKHMPDGFQRSGILLNPPPRGLRGAVAQMKARRPLPGQSSISHHLSISTNPKLPPEFTYPTDERDELFDAKYRHIGGKTCADCDRANLVRRDARPDPRTPVVHYGIIASGNQVMKDALLRDKLAAKYNILCFEMEAAGLKIALPCLAIRGISDYSDSHKNQQWQKYAATTAAAYAKELFQYVPIERILETRSLATTVVPGTMTSPSNSNSPVRITSVDTTSHARSSPTGPETYPPNTASRTNKASPRLNILISPFHKESEKLHITYQRLLSRNSFGNALYWPVDVTDIFPGCVGYFNGNGHWKKLKTDIKSDGKKLLSDIRRVDSGEFACGVITSSNVRHIDFDLTSSAEYIPS